MCSIEVMRTLEGRGGMARTIDAGLFGARSLHLEWGDLLQVLALADRTETRI